MRFYKHTFGIDANPSQFIIRKYSMFEVLTVKQSSNKTYFCLFSSLLIKYQIWAAVFNLPDFIYIYIFYVAVIFYPHFRLQSKWNFNLWFMQIIVLMVTSLLSFGENWRPADQNIITSPPFHFLKCIIQIFTSH